MGVSKSLTGSAGRTRTGDCGFRAWMTPQSVFVSVARLAGSDSLQIRQRVLRVRIPLSPPPSLLLQRLSARGQEEPLKIPRFRGVLAVGPWCIRTGDCGFRAWTAPLSVFFSVAKLGGSDSPSIRPGDGRGSAEQHCKFEFLCCQVGGLDSLSIRPSGEQGSVEQYCEFESYSLRQVVRDSGESVPGARSGGEFPAIPRGIG